MEEDRPYDEYYEIDLREYIQVLWNGKWIIIGLFIVSVLAAGIVSNYFIAPMYKTEAAIQLTNVQQLPVKLESSLQQEDVKSNNELHNNYTDVDNAVKILKSTKLVAPIIKELREEYSTSELKSYIDDNIKVKSDSDQNINITVKSKDPKLAYKLTDSIINNFKAGSEKYYNEIINQQQSYLNTINEEIEELNKRLAKTNETIDKITQSSVGTLEKSILLDGLASRLNTYQQQKNELLEKKYRLNYVLSTYHPLEVLDESYIPKDPVSPNVRLNIAIAGVLGLMLGVFIVFFREFLNEEDILESKTEKV